MPAAARGDPATQRRDLKALWEVAQREPVRAELLLNFRPQRTSLDARGAAQAVDLDHAVHVLSVDDQAARIGLANVGLDSARHA